jgi:hypothetical protein
MSVPIPPGYTLTDGFTGFANEQGASLLVTEWSQGEQSVNAEIDLPGLSERGMSLVEELRVPVDGGERRLLRVLQRRPHRASIERRILIIGNADSTSILTATAPSSPFPSDLSEALRAAIRDDDRVIEPFAGLGFELDENETLAVSSRIAQVVHMTARDIAIPGPGDARLIAGRAPHPVGAPLFELAADRLALTPGVRRIEVVSDRQFEIAGLPAIELVARAEDLHSRDPITLLQVIALESGRYFIVQGRVASEQAERYLPEFREVAESFRRTGTD